MFEFLNGLQWYVLILLFFATVILLSIWVIQIAVAIRDCYFTNFGGWCVIFIFLFIPVIPILLAILTDYISTYRAAISAEIYYSYHTGALKSHMKQNENGTYAKGNDDHDYNQTIIEINRYADRMRKIKRYCKTIKYELHDDGTITQR